MVWHPGLLPRLHFRNRSCPKVFDMDVIVAPAPLPNPYTHSVCAKKPFFMLLRESSIHMLILITLGCTSIKVDETCSMHLSDKSVWRALLSLPREHCAVRENLSLVLMLPWTTCMSLGKTLSHYGPLCAIICKMISKIPLPLDDLLFLFPGTVCCF